jgi:hypothetical protein
MDYLVFLQSIGGGIDQHRVKVIDCHRPKLKGAPPGNNEQKIARVIQLLEEFRRDSPQIHDRVDAEADKLATPARPQSVLGAIKGTRAAARSCSASWTLSFQP